MKHIWINEELKAKMDKLKTHKRETYGDIVEKLMEFYELQEGKVTDTEVPPTAKEEEMKVEVSPEVKALV